MIFLAAKVPGMVAQCRQWEECLSRDPLKAPLLSTRVILRFGYRQVFEALNALLFFEAPAVATLLKRMCSTIRQFPMAP